MDFAQLKQQASKAYEAATRAALENGRDTGRYNSDVAVIELDDPEITGRATEILCAAQLRARISRSGAIKIYAPFGGIRSKNTAQVNAIARHLDGVPGIKHSYVLYRFLREAGKRQ